MTKNKNEEATIEESKFEETENDQVQEENPELENDTVDNDLDSDENTNVSDKDSDNVSEDDNKESDSKEDINQVEDVRVTNLRKIASAKEKLERDNAKLAKEHNEALEKIKAFEKAKEEEYNFDDDDDKPEPKISKEELKKQILSEIKQTQDVENELKRVSDIVNKERQSFAEVVSTVNVSSLMTIDPEEYAKLEKEPDLVKKALGAYDAIMKHKLHKLEIKENTKKVNDNLAKPKHAFVANQKSSSFKNLYTKDAQEVLRKELEDSRSRV